MTGPTFGDYGEQGDFSNDGQLEDALVASGLGEGGAAAPARDTVQDTQPIPQGGPLLEEPNAQKLFRMVDGIVMRQERVAKNREERAKHWNRVRGGVPFSYLEKNEDRSIYRATLAPGVEDIGGQPVPNKMDDLCNKIISQILADDFLPNPKPDGDADRDRGAADLTKKFLRADGTASGTDDKQLVRDALNMNITAASSFAMVWVDKTGGGWRPKQVNAHPQATDASKPLYAPRIDPQTGQPIMTATGPIMERTSSPVLRYVAEVPNPQDPTAPPTLTFTENAAEAARQWLPKHRRRLLNINQVRTVPQSANVFDAEQIILLMYDSLDEAKKRFAVLGTMNDAQLKTVCQWRPRRWKSVVPESHRPKDEGDGERAPTGDTLVMWYEVYCRIAPTYQDGAQVCVNGANSGTVLLRDTLREDVELDEGQMVPVLMDPPVTQFLAASDTEDCDAFGSAPISRFGGGNEAWSHIWVGLFDAMHKALNPNVFIPGTSPVTREDYNRRDGTPIEILTKDDKPEVEDAPVLPSFVPDLLERLEVTLNSAAGTNETSNGLDSSYSTSGVAKDISIKQARTALAQYWQNLVKGLTHYWRIKAQLAQARLTVPQMVKLSGVDSAYKQPWFVGSDLCGVSEIALEPGTGTMQQPAEKAQYLALLQTQMWLDPETAGELARSSMTDDLGLAPNVHEEAVNREIGEWSKGPPPGWEDQAAQYQQVMAAYQPQADAALQQLTAQGIDPATAQQQVQASLPAPTPPASPFADRPNNREQTVAMIRHRRFSRMMSTVEYSKHPPAWRQLFDQSYEEARQAAGVATVAEQQQAAQAQADAATQHEEKSAATQQDQKAKEAEAERRFKAQESERDRQTQLESEARRSMSQESRPPRSGARASASLPA